MVKYKGTLDPLQRNSVNMNDDVPSCIICQSPHSSEYFKFSQSFRLGQNVQTEEEEEEKCHDDVSCNMVSMYDDCMDFNLEEIKIDFANKRVSY